MTVVIERAIRVAVSGSILSALAWAMIRFAG